MGKNNAGVAARTKTFQVRLSAIESQMLDELAALEGLSAAEWIRFHIRHAHIRAIEKDR